MPKVFLSHSWKDKAFARKLAEQLRLNGVEVWIDEAEPRCFILKTLARGNNEHFGKVLANSCHLVSVFLD